jgi:hypothetical protein
LGFAPGAGASAQSQAQVAAPAVKPQPGTPAYLQQAYDLSYLSQTAGSSDTVAIVDPFDDPSAESDLATYRATFGLAACTTQNWCLRKVDQTGRDRLSTRGHGRGRGNLARPRRRLGPVPELPHRAGRPVTNNGTKSAAKRG